MIRFDTLMVIIIVAAAAFYLIKRFFVSGSAPGCSCSCECESAPDGGSSLSGCSSVETKTGNGLPEEGHTIKNCSGCGCGGK